MLRLLHLADVHLGARHADLGTAATAQRARQFAAFRAAVELAIGERLDLVLVAGDLFDSNTQPRRTVDAVAAELARLAAARIPVVLVPGTHDAYDRASIYRAWDLPALAGAADDRVVLLTPDRPWVHLPGLDVVVHGPVFPVKRAPRSPLRDLPAAVAAAPASTWRVGLLHAAIAIPGRTDGDDVVVTTEEIAASGLDYLALGHWHSAQSGRAGSTTWAYAGAPEPVAIDQDGAGKVLVVTLEATAEGRAVRVDERTVGRTRLVRREIDAGTIGTQPALVDALRAGADPDVVLDVRLVGVRPDELDLEPGEVEAALRDAYLRVRIVDRSVAALDGAAAPSPGTVAAAFEHDLRERIAALEASGSEADAAGAAELRDALRIGRLLLAGRTVAL